MEKNNQQKFLKFPNFEEFIEKFVSRITMASGAGQRVVPSQAPVQPLGPNTNIVNRGPDSALLRPSIKTSVTGEQTQKFENFSKLFKFQGVRQIIKALESSQEIRDYLLNEVNVVYECKVCMNMFRYLIQIQA